jgi:hypothetical protein
MHICVIVAFMDVKVYRQTLSCILFSFCLEVIDLLWVDLMMIQMVDDDANYRAGETRRGIGLGQ